MTMREAELSRLAQDCEIFNHIFEVLDRCDKIRPEAFKRLVCVINGYILQTVARLYGP